ncbi:MAG: type VI secretion system protein TssA [Bryobacteraceae bacterium]|nr:type VI secretion system protein TssA [Bryobacteraceae bacterium]
MPLREDILNPIAGDNPAGVDLRYDPVYDKIKEARREDDELSQGVWQTERKTADWNLVIRLCQESIATRSKDVQLAAWLSEALLRTRSFGGFLEGLQLCFSLLEKFWDHCYPIIEDGDMELRVAPLVWICTKFENPLRMVPLVRDGYSLYKYKESRAVGYEDKVQNDAQKKAREKMIKEGKLTPEAFDKAFGETPKPFYKQMVKDLDSILALIEPFDKFCYEKFGDDTAPSFNKLKDTVTEIRHLTNGFLQKKLETDPDPVEEAPPAEAPAPAEGEGAAEGEDAAVPVGGGTAAAPARATYSFSVTGSAEPADRKAAVDSVVSAAALLRKREPTSPAPYLMLRGLRWGELRAGAKLSDPALLEAPPSEIRRQVKQLALDGRWKELLEAAEAVMALPCSRAWLDLQRLVVEACAALGSDYDAIAIALRSELRALLRDIPQLLTASLMDDTPCANAETAAWLKEVLEEPPAPAAANGRAPSPEDGAGWKKRFVDPYDLAKELQRGGKEAQAFEVMHREIERQRSGRGRFERRLQLVQMLVSSGKDAIAQPILEDLIAAVDAHKLEEWEDREKIAQALATIMKASKRIQGDAKEKQKLFDRICRLDPVQAMSV